MRTPETETSQKKSDSTRLDSVWALLDSARLDIYFKKTLLDSTRLGLVLNRLDSTRLDSTRLKIKMIESIVFF